MKASSAYLFILLDLLVKLTQSSCPYVWPPESNCANPCDIPYYYNRNLVISNPGNSNLNFEPKMVALADNFLIAASTTDSS